MVDLVERECHGFKIIFNQDDGYVNFGKLVEEVDKSKVERQGGKVPTHVSLSQWGDTEHGAATLKEFAGIHPSVKTHYRLQKGVPRAYSGVYIHPTLIYSVMIWRDHLVMFYMANILNLTNSFFHGKTSPDSFCEQLKAVTKPSKMISYNKEVPEKPPILLQQEKELRILESIDATPSACDKTQTDISGNVKPTETTGNAASACGKTAGNKLPAVPTKEEQEAKLTVESVARGRKRFYKGGGRYGSKRKPVVSGTSTAEEDLQTLLVNLLQKPFIKVRPEWLRNPQTGRCMELDMYNEELKLAVEYNGEQHYRIVKPFTNSEEELKAIKERDLLKVQLCRDNGVRLITIPYTIPSSKFATYITKILQTLSIV